MAARSGDGADARNIRISNHLWPEISAQLLCVTPTAHWLEYADWWNPILSEPLRDRERHGCRARYRGTGVAWEESVVERLSV